MRALACAFALAAMALVLPAQAGDAAARRVIGFSPDGAFFAFEQYTMLYEDDAAFSEYVFIDTRTDRLVAETPLKALVRGDDGLDEKIARAQAQERAAPLIAELKIAEPGTRIEGRPSMDLDEIGIYQMDAKPLAKTLDFTLPDGRKAKLALSQKPLGSALCEGAGGRATPGKVKVSGARLTLALGGTPIVLQDDKTLPKARRCVSAYGIAEAYLHKAPDDTITIAVLVELVDNHEYHAGPNRRFMAVTRRVAGK